MTDPRIVFGARCTWWDSIDKVDINDDGLPVCPHCHGVLFEADDLKDWWQGVDDYERKHPAPGYRRFVTWQRGKCFADGEAAHAAYRKVQ